MDKIHLFHLGFTNLSEEQFIQSINDNIVKKEMANVVTPNMDILRITYKNLDARKAMNNATYCTIDGQIVFILSKLFRSKIKYKFSGSDMVFPILKLAEDKKYKIYLFGGRDESATLAKERIEKEYPNVVVCGTYCPNLGYENNEVETKDIIKNINESKPDIVLLCTGSPKTELFYNKIKSQLCPAVYLSLGATIDFLAGTVKRAPKWMSKCGLEWLYRLTKDFKRLFKRYWLDFWFLLKLFFVAIFNKKKLLNKYQESLD